MSYASHRRGRRRQKKAENLGAIIGLLTGGIGGFLGGQRRNREMELEERKVEIAEAREEAAQRRSEAELAMKQSELEHDVREGRANRNLKWQDIQAQRQKDATIDRREREKLELEGEKVDLTRLRSEAYAEEKRAKALSAGQDAPKNLSKEMLGLYGAVGEFSSKEDAAARLPQLLKELEASIGEEKDIYTSPTYLPKLEKLRSLQQLRGVMRSPYAAQLFGGGEQPAQATPGAGGAAPATTPGGMAQGGPSPVDREANESMNVRRAWFDAFNQNLPPAARLGAWGYLQKLFPDKIPQSVQEQFQGAGR